MAKLELLLNEKKVRRFLIVDDRDYSDGLHSYYGYYYQHLGEIFEPVTIRPCRYQNMSSDERDVCSKCAGHVQAPWMDHPECWGLRGIYRLIEV